MLNLNPTTLNAVVEQACIDAAAHGRWLVAIGRAVLELEANPWIQRNADGHGLLIGSPSGSVYSSNGTCQCRAYEFKQPCWHRAAARIVRLCDEREAAAAYTQAADAGAFGPAAEDYSYLIDDDPGPYAAPAQQPQVARAVRLAKIQATCDAFNAELFA